MDGRRKTSKNSAARDYNDIIKLLAENGKVWAFHGPMRLSPSLLEGTLLIGASHTYSIVAC